jgi:hypothetical protein
MISKKLISITTVTLVAVFLLFTSNLPIIANAQAQTLLFFDPDPSTEEIGNTFTITLNIRDSPKIWAWYTRVTWNTTILNITEAVEGPFLNQEDVRNTDFVRNINYTRGLIYFGCALKGEPTAAQPSGSGILAELTFTVLSRGEAYFHFNTSSLYDYWYPTTPAKPHTAKDGYFKSPYYTVSVQPPSIHNGTLIADTTFNLSLSAYVENLFSWNATISWNTTILEMVEAFEGPFLKPEQYSTHFGFTMNQTEGTATLNGTLIEPADPANSTSDNLGTLAFIKFKAITLGESHITIEDVDLSNPEGVTIGRRIVSGTFSNIWHDIATQSIDVTVTDNKATIGQIVNVTVVVKNVGNMPETYEATLYANLTVADRQTVSLNPGESSTLTFHWNTTGISAGVYELKASVEPVSGEADTTNNVKSYGMVTVEAPSGLPIPIEIIAAIAIIAVVAIIAVFLLKKRKPPAAQPK